MDINCFLCTEVFTSEEVFSRHIMDVHGNVDVFKCDKCTREFESDASLEVHKMVTHPEDGNSDDSSEVLQFRWVKGYDHNNPNNPGILVVNEEARFAFNKMTEDGAILHYHCLKKATTKCKAKCTIVVETATEEGNAYRVEKMEEIMNHNHVVDKADIIAADMVVEMHKRFRKELNVKPSVVRKKIFQKYRAIYSIDETWKKIIDVLPENASIDRGIARIREKVWGKMPTNREDLEYKKVLDSVEGGEVVEVLDSNKMWEDKKFREQLVETQALGDIEFFEDFEETEEDFVPDNPLARVIIFTSKQQLEIFESCEKGSVDGNFKIAPTHFSQVFVMMLKFNKDNEKKENEKWVPVSFALLPSKSELSYKLFFNMLKFELKKRNIQFGLKKIIVDFEIAIQTSALSVFDYLVILGCFFHFGQCLLRKVQNSRMVGPYKKDAEFNKFVRSCISLPFLPLDELQDTVDQLRETEFEDEECVEMKDDFLDYIQDTWMDGEYPPHTWNCHGRNNENTNNNIERYNGILNRLIEVQHPNAYVLFSNFITEIASAITIIEKVQAAKKMKTRRSKYIQLGEEREELREASKLKKNCKIWGNF